ncbi:MAG: CBS domain-containing protein [Planctomycetota bacterium]
MIRAREVLAGDTITIRPSCALREAIDLLLESEVSGLPVTDDAGHLVGIITEFAMLAITYDDCLDNDLVAQHMTTDVLTVDVNDPISKAADLCIVHRVRRVPVMENGKLVGLISRRDVLRAVYESAYSATAT